MVVLATESVSILRESDPLTQILNELSSRKMNPLYAATPVLAFPEQRGSYEVWIMIFGALLSVSVALLARLYT